MPLPIGRRVVYRPPALIDLPPTDRLPRAPAPVGLAAAHRAAWALRAGGRLIRVPAARGEVAAPAERVWPARLVTPPASTAWRRGALLSARRPVDIPATPPTERTTRAVLLLPPPSPPGRRAGWLSRPARPVVAPLPLEPRAPVAVRPVMAPAASGWRAGLLIRTRPPASAAAPPPARTRPARLLLPAPAMRHRGVLHLSSGPLLVSASGVTPPRPWRSTSAFGAGPRSTSIIGGPTSTSSSASPTGSSSIQ